jgi:signal transduction histidine kinase
MNIVEADHTFLAALTVLYVEDDVGLRTATTAFLRRRVARVLLAADGAAGLAAFRQQPAAILVTDLQMPNMDGLTLVETLHADDPDLPVIVTTAFERTDYLLRAIDLGVDRYVLKPVNVDRLEAALLYCAHILRLKHEAAVLHQAKAELLQAQHEETLGILAGGMAHDYNNLIQAVMTQVAMARLAIAKPALALEFLNQAETGWAQAKELGSNLLLLSRTRDFTRQTGSILPTLRKVLDLKLQPPAFTVSYDLPEDLPMVRYNPRQLERVFAVLATNAQEAMGSQGRLQVQATLASIALDDPLALRPGDYLQLSLSDSGAGIDPVIFPILFSPYSTSKTRGAERGMGMGLAVARAILHLHGGALAADGPDGDGATLRCYLPVADTEQAVS